MKFTARMLLLLLIKIMLCSKLHCQTVSTWSSCPPKSGCISGLDSHGGFRGSLRINLIHCINWMVSGSQLPHKSVILLFRLVMVNNKLTIFWGSWFSKKINTLCKLQFKGSTSAPVYLASPTYFPRTLSRAKVDRFALKSSMSTYQKSFRGGAGCRLLGVGCRA